MSLFMTVEMLIQSLLAMNALLPRSPRLGAERLIVDAGRPSRHRLAFFDIAGRMRDFAALMKPRVMLLSVFTALVGLIIAPIHLDPILATTAVGAIAGGAGAAGALNMWYDADIDRIMARTAMRPIPRGRVSRSEALLFGLLLAAVSISVLGFWLNLTAAALLAGAIIFYVGVYTAWLKRRTPQNIVIGGAAGALPPVGLSLAVLLTATSFWVANTSLLWPPGVALGLAVLAIAQMGIHLVFFLHITTGRTIPTRCSHWRLAF